MAAVMEGESARRVSGCVTALLHEQPFFGSLALRLPLRADPSRETLASDGWEIRYAPAWAADTDAHVIEAALARVVLACALKHHTRRRGRDPERWQRASQLATHGLLRDAGFALPPDAEAWDGLSVEEAYDRLPEPQGGNSGNSGNPSPGVGGASAGGSEGGSGQSDEDGGGEGQNGSGDGNRNKGGPSDPPQSHDPSGTGEIMDAPAGQSGDAGSNPAPSASDTAAEEQAWDEAMHQALSLAKAEGKVPGRVEETIRGAHASRLDWRALLRRHMTDAAKNDYSWSLPNRRFIDSGLYLPSIRSEGMETVAVILDTSGSLPADILAAFWVELRGIADELRPERIVVLQVDAAVQDAAEYAPGDLPDRIVVRGRGGTDFRPGFAWLEDRSIRPSACLYLTDMDCSRYPETEPPYPTIWCNWGDPPSRWNREPWGERIDIGSP